MTKLQETSALAAQLDGSDKLELLSLLVKELFGKKKPEESGITKSPDVCGGSARIANTRISVWSIVEAKQLGMSDKDILESFTNISLKDIENALLYYATNRAEIESDIAQNNIQ
ncbi:MAG: DUF433 domain-containing protein [Bacteroidota bacterium]